MACAPEDDCVQPDSEDGREPVTSECSEVLDGTIMMPCSGSAGGTGGINACAGFVFNMTGDEYVGTCSSWCGSGCARIALRQTRRIQLDVVHRHCRLEHQSLGNFLRLPREAVVETLLIVVYNVEFANKIAVVIAC